jgi:hypothetical protein
MAGRLCRKEPALWRAACYRDFGEATIHNKLHLTLNKTWEWVYQAKAVRRPPGGRSTIHWQQPCGFIDLTSLCMCACHVSWCRIVSDGGVSRCLHHQVKLSQRDRILDRQIGHYEDPFEVLLPVGLHTIVRIAVVLLLLLLLRCYRCLLYILANPEARLGMVPHQGGCWEGQWKRAAGSIFSRGSPLPNISGYGIAIASSLVCVGSRSLSIQR